jgi:hypothetical protein
VLEFTELQGTHSGENLANAVENMLVELNLEHKLISITGDNAGNNEAMASELYFSLSDRSREQDANPAPLCLILFSWRNLIFRVGDPIRTEKSYANLGLDECSFINLRCCCLAARQLCWIWRDDKGGTVGPVWS